jgi:hypothetical protein
MSQLLATLTEGFNLLSGRGRPLTKTQTPVDALPYEKSPIPANLWDYGAITRRHRSVAAPDHGMLLSHSRFESEKHPISYDCLVDGRQDHIIGGNTRFYGRPPRISRI